MYNCLNVLYLAIFSKTGVTYFRFPSPAQGDIFIGRCPFFFWGTACTFVGNVRLVPRKKMVPRALLLEKCSRYLYATGCEVGNLLIRCGLML